MAPKPDKAKRNLFIANLFLLALSFALIVTLIVELTSRRIPESHTPFLDQNICKSDTCIAATKYLLDSVDFSIDPCKDFYQYSCNKWHSRNPIPALAEGYSVTDKINTELKKNILNVLDTSDLRDEEQKYQIVRDTLQYYNACMNTDAIDARGLRSITEYLNEFFKNPILNKNWKPAEYNWDEGVANAIRETGQNYIIRWMVTPHKENTNYIIEIGKPSFVLPSDILNGNKTESYQRYRDLVHKIFTLMLKPAAFDINDDVNGILDFEIELYEFPFSSNARNITITELQNEIPGIDWLNYMQTITNETLIQLNQVFRTDELIIVYDAAYLKAVMEYLNNEKTLRQAANYILWRVISSRIEVFPTVFQDAFQEYYNYPKMSRNQVCFNMVNNAFPEVIANLYIWRNFPPSSKNETTEMVYRIRNQFNVLISEAKWMDPYTKDNAQKKLQKMKLEVGYPDWITSLENIQKLYNAMKKPMNNDAFENLIISKKSFMHKVVEKLRIVNTDFQLLDNPTTVNAVYSRNRNEIMVSAGILNSPFYYPDIPLYMNYAAIGAVIGHELTHGFDTEGSKHDADGTVTNWWSPEAAEKFKNKTQCFINQYNNYHLDGTQTIAENIADTGGLRLAYYAYVNALKESEVQPKLIGFNDFSTEKLFFLAYGSIWCNNVKNETSDDITMKSNKHSPSNYRLIGSIANLPEFSKTFNCPKKSAMNPEEKCELW